MVILPTAIEGRRHYLCNGKAGNVYVSTVGRTRLEALIRALKEIFEPYEN
jgi:hypothetical protein